MAQITEYIEEAKRKLKFDSYNQTMKHLGMTRQQWTAIQKGSGVSDKNAIRIAKLLKIEPLEIIAISKALRAENREIREYWLKVEKSIKEQRLKEGVSEH